MAGKVDALRAMREARYEEAQAKHKQQAAKPARLKVAKAALAQSNSPAPVQAKQSNSKFDKTAYQRAYMRKRRVSQPK